MAEYIDLNNTEVLTEAGENAKLVVEEDGELKRIPASAVGQVKAVNGVEPDETGNVVVSGLPEGATANHVLATNAEGAVVWEEKPFYEEEIVIEWDGNISDRVHVVTDGMGTWVKMTDRVLAAEEIIGASYETSYRTAGTFAENNVDEYEGVVNTVGNCPTIVSIPSDNIDIDGMFLIPEKGTYFVNLRMADGQYYCTKFIKNKVKPLDAKFLPGGVGANYLVITGKAPAASATDIDYSTFEYSANLSFDYAAKLIRAGQLAGVAVNLIATYEEPESGAYEVETRPIGVVAYVLGGNANGDGIVIVTGGDSMADMYNHPYPFTSQQRFEFTKDGVQLVVPS